MQQENFLDPLQKITEKFLRQAAETDSARQASRSLQVVSQAIDLATRVRSQSDFHTLAFLSRLENTVSRSALHGCYLEFCGVLGIQPCKQGEFYRLLESHCRVYKSGSEFKVTPMIDRLEIGNELLKLPAVVRMPEALTRRKR